MGISIEVASAQYNTTKVGWVNEPDGRGTLSILISCISSLFLSSWAVMHLNIAQRDSSKTRRLATYFYWCIYGIFGPELVIWTAWRQLLSAWALRDELRKQKIGNDHCTIAYGFYALMGGIVIDISKVSEKDDAPFINGIERLTLTPKGLLLLARCGHLPKVTEEEIQDKSKVDELGKLLACTQVTWMIVQVCTRLGLSLPVTTLEVTAVSHVMCALVLYALWWHKPRKVDEPTILIGDWVRPLAAFMLMCSKESQGQMLPEYKLEDEHSEMAGLKVIEAPCRGSSDITQASSLHFVHKGPPASEAQHISEEGASSRDVRGALISPSPAGTLKRSLSANALLAEVTHEKLDHTTKTRWELARIAIRKYEAVRNLLRPPPSEHNRFFELALATYPEMPEKCKRGYKLEEAGRSEDKWLECTTQHFVSTLASNWPHDGLLRTTSGLWIGASLWIVSIAFSCIHIAAWYAPFPTNTEAWLWRSASSYVAFSGVLWAAIHILATISATLWWTWYKVMSGHASKWLNVSLGVICSICGLAYLFSRAYLIIESFIALRHLPIAVYVVPEWTLGVPHIA